MKSAHAQQLAHRLLARLPKQDPVALTVAEWLARSRAAHLDYRRAHDDRQHVPAATALATAAYARAQAELLDPDHADVAWTDNGGTHPAGEATHDSLNDPLLTFYDTTIATFDTPDTPDATRATT